MKVERWEKFHFAQERNLASTLERALAETDTREREGK